MSHITVTLYQDYCNTPVRPQISRSIRCGVCFISSLWSLWLQFTVFLNNLTLQDPLTLCQHFYEGFRFLVIRLQVFFNKCIMVGKNSVLFLSSLQRSRNKFVLENYSSHISIAFYFMHTSSLVLLH